MPQTFLVTGATRGIGLEFVKQLTARRDRVIATARDPERPGPLGEHDVQRVGLDVSEPWSIDGLGEALENDGVDVLINNAGVSSESRTLSSLDVGELERVFRVNAFAPILVSRAVLPALLRGKRRLIVNITSVLGSIAQNTGGSSYAYRASKTALNQLSVCMANELKPQGVSVVMMHPGWVRTDMGGPQAHLTPEQSVRAMIAVIDRLSLADSGRYLNYDGAPIPW